MTTTYARRVRARIDRTYLLLVGVIAVCWAAAAAVELSGVAPALRHDELSDAVLAGATPLWPAGFLVAGSWMLMTGAMMLPSSVPMVRVFARSARTAPNRHLVMAAFLAGYFLVWSAFGVLAFMGDLGVHTFERSWARLGSNPQLIPAATFTLAAVWQLTPLKDACLKECRHPVSFMVRYYRRGVGAGLELGLRHGAFCLGCCWAMMLVMFAAGVANLAWMGALAVVMLAEKTFPEGDRLSPVLGGAFAVMAVVALMMPSWFA